MIVYILICFIFLFAADLCDLKLILFNNKCIFDLENEIKHESNNCQLD